MFSPCALALDLTEGGSKGDSLTCALKGSCHHEVPFALRLADEPSRFPLKLEAELVVGGKHQALHHRVWFTLLLWPAWLWCAIHKYSAARGFSWERFAHPWLWAFLALVNSVPSGCCSDQLYPAVETAQASLSNLIISSYWRALGSCDVKWKFSGPRSRRGSY